MIVFGIFLLILGSISEWIVDNHITVADQVVNMDDLGILFLVLGVLSLLFGLLFTSMETNTSHYEKRVDEVPDKEPVVIKRRKPRTKKGIK